MRTPQNNRHPRRLRDSTNENVLVTVEEHQLHGVEILIALDLWPPCLNRHDENRQPSSHDYLAILISKVVTVLHRATKGDGSLHRPAKVTQFTQTST